MTAHQIEYLDVATLTPYARNSRIHSDDQVAMLADSIRRFGFNQPVLIDGEGTIVAGHGRVMAAKSAGLEQVPCIRLLHLTDAERRAYVIADNRIAEHARWDDALLSSELEQITLDDDFGASELGFDDEAWASLIGPDANDFGTGGLDDALAAVAPRDRPASDEPTADDHADRGAGARNAAEGKGMQYPVILQLNKAAWQRWKQWRGKRTDTDAVTALLDLAATCREFGVLGDDNDIATLAGELERLTAAGDSDA